MPKAKNNRARTRTLLQHVSFVKTLDEAGGLCTSSDYIYAAAITGLGISIQDNLRTIRYAATAKSLAPGAIDAARLYAASIDMLLVRMNASQLYGTQFGGSVDRPTKVPMLDDVLPKDEVARLGIDSPNDSPFVQPLEIFKNSSN